MMPLELRSIYLVISQIEGNICEAFNPTIHNWISNDGESRVAHLPANELIHS